MRIERVAEEAIARGLELGELRERVRAEVAAARGRGFVGAQDDRRLPRRARLAAPDPTAAAAALARPPARLADKALLELLLARARGQRRDRRPAAGPGPLRLRRRRPAPPARATRPARAADRALRRHAVRAPALLPVRARGGLARARLRERLLRPLAHDPARLRAGEALREALELAPFSKLLYASDAARTPELYFLAATWWRDALAEVLAEALPADEAEAAGRRVLRENALALYRL